MKRLLYIDGAFGISGDMLAGALLDLGADYEALQQVLDSLQLQGFSTKVSRVKKSGLDMCDFMVELDAAHENHDHDMAYLHGEGEHCHEHEHEHEHHHHEHKHEEGHGCGHYHEEHCGHEHEHQEEHHHHHDHDHEHDHMRPHEHHHHHEHRGMGEIRELIHHSSLTEQAKETALEIFQVLARAEAKAHGTTIDQVHFHEVGAVDSIVDIVTIAFCLDNLGIEGAVVGALTEGTGTVRCQHGLMAVPVPAVTNIVTEQGLKLKISNIEGELVTPTGAAAASAIRTAEGLPEDYRIAASGMGAGKREYSVPTFLRVLLLEVPEAEEQEGLPKGAGMAFSAEAGTGEALGEGFQDTVLQLETNIDDGNGEMLGLAMEKLLAAGALDAFYTPIYMKKNRPAYLLTVLCALPDGEKLKQIIFRHTTSIGIRCRKIQRTIMSRRILQGEIDGVAVQAKECRYGDIVKVYPECESIRKLQEQREIDYTTAYELVKNTFVAK